ncbi:DUF2878 domain-containing protein [Marinomonas transparens]|uniref:DUF2878 domain-containing protein n=1 Tax=Marinomonas transparens TaxID=2795388 RepID=A0A934JP22_9GAMM|nr:DUF2878 domain-containing protein [Marinomonas transparens]MBJ7538018.1 DUF2878 domain-containing protein [Marinomonas transparens]
MKRLINAVLFQVVWFACLLGGNVWALVATAAYLAIHRHYFMKSPREWRLLAVFVLLGVMVDGALFEFGVFSAEKSMFWVHGLPPIWLLCLWLSVATLFPHSLVFLRSRYWLSAGVGMVGPTLSYYAGAKMTGIMLAEPTWLSLVIVAFLWALILPLGLYLSEKWGLFEMQGTKT